jgi:hypothetical protein
MTELRVSDLRSDHMYEVCLEEDGFTECCYVSSLHLVKDKSQQLKDAVRRRALNAFVEHHSINAICDV